jgi:hypothetical protein
VHFNRAGDNSEEKSANGSIIGDHTVGEAVVFGDQGSNLVDGGVVAEERGRRAVGVERVIIRDVIGVHEGGDCGDVGVNRVIERDIFAM